jgi:hypothetical protein
VEYPFATRHLARATRYQDPSSPHARPWPRRLERRKDSRQGKGTRIGQECYLSWSAHTRPRFSTAWNSNLSPQARIWIDSVKRNVVTGLGLEVLGRGYDPEIDGIPFGGMTSSRIKGGEAETNRFLSKLYLFTLAESLSGVESLVEVPEKMTHGGIPADERAVLGIGPDLIRISVGIEDPEDLVRDIENVLRVRSLLFSSN